MSSPSNESIFESGDDIDDYSTIIDDFETASSLDDFHKCMKDLEEFTTDDFSNVHLRSLISSMNTFISCEDIDSDIQVDTINDRNELIKLFDKLVNQYKSNLDHLMKDSLIIKK